MKSITAGMVFLMASCAPAAAQVMCGGIFGFIEVMASGKFEQQGRGNLAGGKGVQVWAKGNGEYVIAVIDGNTACVVASGENWINSNRGGDL